MLNDFYFYFLLIGAFFLTPIALLILYRHALPKPIPRIPHRGTHRSLLGDLKDIGEFRKKSKQIIQWLTEQTTVLGSPLAQIFVQPFGKPMLILNDFREAEDICTRRMHEFDVSETTFALFERVVPHATISMRSDEHFKAQRRLWAGSMSTEFLHRIAAPAIFNSGQMLVDLWQRKIKQAPDVPWASTMDLRYCALDGIWSAALGSDLGGLPAQIETINMSQGNKVPIDVSGAAVFPEATLSPLLKAIDTLLDSMANLQATPMPRLLNYLQSRLPHFRAAYNLKDRIMGQMLSESRRKFSGPDTFNVKPTCAMEQVLQREAISQEKSPDAGQSRAASDRYMIDELFVWLVAGHETTVTTMGWGVKYLNEHARVQHKLRAAIKDVLGTTQVTDVEQIIGNEIPYLDAIVWEILRLARPAGAVMRTTRVDTDILGYHVPKGIDIMISTSGFSALDIKQLPVREEDRSRSSQAAKRIGCWDFATLKDFAPERWLVEHGGKITFDLNAGPVLPFGAGNRGCFGRRLAVIELKVFVTLLVMAFDFQRVPDHLNSYEGIDRVTRQPLQSYVRPKSV